MKKGFLNFKRALAVVLCFALMDFGNLTTQATEEMTISSGDAVVQNFDTQDEDSVSGGDVESAAVIQDTSAPLSAAPAVSGSTVKEIQLTINHYIGEGAEDANMLFAPQTVIINVENGASIEVVREQKYYDVEKVTLNGETVEWTQDGKIQLEKMAVETAVVNVFYRRNEDTYRNKTTMIDYDSEINDAVNYPAYSAENNRMSTIQKANKYITLKEMKDENDSSYHFNINSFYRQNYTRSWSGKWRTYDGENASTRADATHKFAVLTGLLDGLSESKTGSGVYDIVNFHYDDPGFFTSEYKRGKTIYDSTYSLEFARNGMEYTLIQALKDGYEIGENGRPDNFFPLNQGDRKNEYFGMRYDFSFKTGDYVGDMMYGFTGDDDLWVCLDGEVILDLGGIHSACSDEVDVWAKLLGKEAYTTEEKIAYVSNAENANKEHVVTVLFMERGGNASNCNMKFVMPNVVAHEPVITTSKLASLNLRKVDAETKTAMQGVTFALTGDGQETQELATDREGYIVFGNLKEGTYILTETTPVGYLPAGPWTVKVTSESNTDGNITVITHSVESVTDAQGTPLMADEGVYTIANTAIEMTVSQSKNAELVDWQNRIYKVSLAASARAKQEEGGITIPDMENIALLPVTGASVIDSIDGRFRVTDAAGNVLPAGSVIKDAYGNTGLLHDKADGSQYVEWCNLTIQGSADGTAGWSAEIYVRAKEDFLGGNMIPTNGSDSGISLGDDFVPFDKPTVNVRLLKLSLSDLEMTLFKGEMITPAKYIEAISNLLSAEFMEALPGLNSEQAEQLMRDKTLTVDYTYAGEKTGTFTYSLTDYGSKWKDHKAVAVGEKAETYGIKVYFTAETLSDRKAVMSHFEEPNTVVNTESFDGEEVKTTEESTGICTVNVVAGSLKVSKEIDVSETDFTQGDPVFTFKVLKDGNFFCYATVRFDSNKTGNKVVLELQELEKGIYTVEELNTLRYGQEGCMAKGIGKNPAAVADGKKAVFGIGRDEESEETLLHARDGEAVFRNSKNNDRNFSHTDVVINHFVIGEDGNISWTADTLRERD